ncbi:ankyrin repeat domain-containing protein [Sunxiuqinia indica]|uniref:ankyrin repeat domain-containing protein n=1 Tax=Sunxiuqinia indica TaxID=2692584 RepID=UPI00135725E6|nr:ankyrin repeat domain-containing protein [Sunxiuqinia indica]
MRTHPVYSFKTVFSFFIAILLFMNACVQSGSSSSTETGKETKAKALADKPTIDLQTAILSDNLEAVRQHIEAGTDINLKDQMTGSTPLITAVTFDKTAIAKALIDADAQLNLKNNDGSTALHAAAFFCRVEITQMLLDAKADKTVKNNFGATPRESVTAPFADMKPIYEMIGQQLAPFGLKLDLKEVEKTRPVIAMMLQ